MFTLTVPAWQIAVRSAVVYIAILFLLRLAGKREVGQMTLFDLVLLLLANAVQNAMVGDRLVEAQVSAVLGIAGGVTVTVI
jgi:uncharacterized membrane protein YcaP (DUF421 family)